MSSSLHIQGIKPGESSHQKMYDIYKHYLSLGIFPPEKVLDYFENEEPDLKGLPVDLKEFEEAVEGFSETGMYGYHIEIDKLPSEIKILRVYISY